jgi:hypothetical protein
MVEIALNKNFYFFKAVPPHLITEEIARKAIATNILDNFPRLPNHLRKNYCLDYIKCNRSIFSYIPTEFLTKEICDVAFNKSVYNIVNIPKEMITNKMGYCVVEYVQTHTHFEYLLKYVPDLIKLYF